jgi:hypothetical protein
LIAKNKSFGTLLASTANKTEHMADDPSKRRPEDSSRINIHEPYELEYWTKEFGVSKGKVIEAVNKVGTSVNAVKKYLGKPK